MFKKKINIGHPKECFNYLRNHSTYNNSIANNVKVYNLELSYPWLTLRLIDKLDLQPDISQALINWEQDHNNYYEVGFDGRSRGYLALYSPDNFNNILPTIIRYSDNYEKFKKNVREDYGSIKNYTEELRFFTKLVRDFDKLCDKLVKQLEKITQEFIKESNEKDR